MMIYNLDFIHRISSILIKKIPLFFSSKFWYIWALTTNYYSVEYHYVGKISRKLLILRKPERERRREIMGLLKWLLGRRTSQGQKYISPVQVINPVESAEMILIPAGEFIMGTSDEQIKELLRQFSSWKREWFADEQPQHRVYLDDFYIDKYPVTNAQFEQFVKATGYKVNSDWRAYYTKGKEKHPVVNVSWNDANAYCKWAGKRLPTEAEWEKAARGTDGRIWPWGNAWDKSKCNSAEGGLGITTPVGSYPAGASPYGVMDMAGNVWEWCADWYDEDYYRFSPARNPQGPSSGTTWRVLRGGSWNNFLITVGVANRLGSNPVIWDCSFGFRGLLRIPRVESWAVALLQKAPEVLSASPRREFVSAEEVRKIQPQVEYPEPSLPSATIINPVDGAEMILIPAGEFIMGTSDEQIEELLRQFPDWNREWFADEQPQHSVIVDGFYIDKYLVTNAQFEQFVKATGYKAEGDWWKCYTQGKEYHPVVTVSWNDANAYCNWAGKRLPTEAEWEKAARGTDGRIWPWGNAWDKSKCNSRDGGPGTTTPVGSYPAGASPYGVMDTAGNVWEWCADWYDEKYYTSAPNRNPQGPSVGTYRVLRGGSWYSNPNDARAAYRVGLIPDGRGISSGFRGLSPRIPC
ncbi:formylglycine-generating enzyme family protein [Candidatus Poribacteria bacterium]|nr:formylglycine-generating enzyme family protein [Candidatus Poribacteria bacterium]